MSGTAAIAGTAASRVVQGSALALVAGAVFWGGGSGASSVPVLGGLTAIAVAALVGASALGLLPLPRPDGPTWLALGALTGLVAWIGLSAWWSIAGDRSWEALAKGLLYLGFAVVGLALAASGRGVPRLLALGLAAVLGGALAWALAGVAVPALFPGGDRIARLREPLGYWNGLALLADAALVLGLSLATAAGAGRRTSIRLAGALLVYAGVLAVLLTQSRAGVVAALVVGGLWLTLSPRPVESLVTAACAGLPALVVAGWVFTRPALVEDGALRADRVDDGALFALALCAGAILACALVYLVPAERLARRPRAVLAWLAVGAAIVLVAGGSMLAVRVGNPVSWAADQFSRGECVNDPSRLTDLCANNRLAWWSEAVDVWRGDRLVGAGANTFELARKRYRDDAANVTQPHSVPLQLLAGTGIVGLGLGALLAAAAAVGLRRALRRLDGEQRAAGAALVALPAAWAIHALVDYPADFLAVTAPAVLVTFAVLGAARPTGRMPGGAAAAAAAGAVALVAIGVMAAPALADRQVERSEELLTSGSLDPAATAAERAQRLAPLAPGPLIAAGRVAEQRGDLVRAGELYRDAVATQPENPEPWFELGVFELYVREDACAAWFAFNEAYTRDPKGRQWTPGGPLDLARDAVNDGACDP
jgi:acyl-coenzyme A thioesterase PaaI-like protein